MGGPGGVQPGGGGPGGSCCTSWITGPAGRVVRSAIASATTQPTAVQPSRMFTAAIEPKCGTWRAQPMSNGSTYAPAHTAASVSTERAVVSDPVMAVGSFHAGAKLV